MVLLRQNTFDGGTPTTAITAANSGGDSGDAFDFVTTASGGSIVYETSTMIAGGVQALVGADGQAEVRWDLPSAYADIAFRGYFRFETVAPATEVNMIRLQAGGTQVASLRVSTLGRLLAYQGSNLITGTNIAGHALSADTNYRIEGIWNINGTSGRVQYAVYSLHSTTPLFSFDSGTTVDFGTADIDRLRVGKTAAVAWDPFRFDEIVLANQSAFIGPWTAPPVAAVTPFQAFISVTEGGTAPFTIGQDSGSAFTPLVGERDSVAGWFVPHHEDTARVYTVTDDNAEESDPVTVAPLPSERVGPKVRVGGVYV